MTRFTDTLRRRIASFVVHLSLAAWASIAQAEDSTPFQLVRADEDCSRLRNAAPGVRGLKFIPLDDSEGRWVSLGGELRERVERFDAARFGFGTSRDAYALQRILLHADLHFGEAWRAFVQFGQHTVYGKDGARAISDRNVLDVQNLFVDYRFQIANASGVRVGRQELLFNAQQRFVSVREGPNVRQSFDGARGWISADGGTLDAFYVRPVRLRTGVFNDDSDPEQQFYGIYLRSKLDDVSIDGYLLGLERGAVRFGNRSGDEHRTSIGMRITGKPGHLDFDWEAVIQTGTFAGERIAAWAVGLDSGYTWPIAWSPRLGIQFDAGSGDRDPNDRRLQTFNPLFPKGAYFNESSSTSWSNLMLARIDFGVRPIKPLFVQASILWRWRPTGAAVYLQPSIALTQTLLDPARYVGKSYQLDARWQLDRFVTVSGEYVRQVAGPAITRNGGRSSNFVMLIGQVRF